MPTPPSVVQPVAQVAPRTRDHAALAAHRAITPGTIEPTGPEPPAVPEPPTSPLPEPPGGSIVAPGPAGPRILTAAELYGNVDNLASAAARAGGVDLGVPGSGYRPSRSLWGPPRTGSRIDQIREAAAGPTMAALAGSNHMQAAGTSEHDSRVARRAEEAFNPVRSIAGLGAAVLRAPRVGLPPVSHEMSPGESAAGSALDSAHGSSFTMMQLGTVPVPPAHTMRADVEVDQDAAGTVVATRVVRGSGLAAFDRAALDAIREALPDAPSLRDGGRRSRWSFEVSESAGAIGMVLGGGNEGWRVISEPSGGVQLRYRVRRVDSRPLQGS
ncbi:MAG: TonB family protein [Deltaproteobacteria bacterium]